MTTIDRAVEVDHDKLMQFVFQVVDEVGATLNTALVVLGDKLGLYRDQLVDRAAGGVVRSEHELVMLCDARAAVTPSHSPNPAT